MTRAYLDHASSSPLRPSALDAMVPYLRDHPGDPGRVHAEGRVARVALETAREQVAALAGARPREVVFTSGGTEAVLTAVAGAVALGRERGSGGRVLVSAVEHSSVVEAARRHATGVVTVGVDRTGRVDPAAVASALARFDDVGLVSVQVANHEVGTRQPAGEIVDVCHRRGVLVHLDACASFGHEPLRFGDLGADLCSVTAHKLGGPKGAGALLVRRGLRIPPLLPGGAQERARRAGIENVAACVGFGAAAAEVDEAFASEAAAARDRTEAIAAALMAVDGVERYGDAHDRLPHIVCFGVAGVEAEPIVLGLDQRGCAVHSGSSCSSELLEPSPVLAAMGVDAEHSLRVSVGWSTVDSDLNTFVSAFPDVVGKLRALRAAQ